MATRKIKDAKDINSGELIYFKGHAKATYMSDGRTVEDAINQNTGEGEVCNCVPIVSTIEELEALDAPVGCFASVVSSHESSEQLTSDAYFKGSKWVKIITDDALAEVITTTLTTPV